MKNIMYALTILTASSITHINAEHTLNDKQVKLTLSALVLGAHYGLQHVALSEYLKDKVAENSTIPSKVDAVQDWATNAAIKESAKYISALGLPEYIITPSYTIDVAQVIDPVVEICYGVGSYCKTTHNGSSHNFDAKKAGKAAVRTGIRELAVHGVVYAGNKSGITQHIQNVLPTWAQDQKARIVYMQALRGSIDALMKKYVK
ncbi:hypothetical protein Noda2021_03340 [Candidatus Dependentiae bacterium Noda2021]|nr:hypothetical protein Noda2021_03340 [Candidatus Dependentiae bacterium Noda2021]